MTALSPEVEADLIRRYRKGQSMQFISFATDVSLTRVRNALLKNKINIKTSAERRNARPGHA